MGLGKLDRWLYGETPRPVSTLAVDRADFGETLIESGVLDSEFELLWIFDSRSAMERSRLWRWWSCFLQYCWFIRLNKTISRSLSGRGWSSVLQARNIQAAATYWTSNSLLLFALINEYKCTHAQFETSVGTE